MSTFSYLLLQPNGKEKKGSIEAKTKEEALNVLKSEGTILSLEAAGALSQDINISFMEKKPTVRDMSVFCRQFVSIINAGVPVTSTLNMLAEQTQNKMLAAAIADCRAQIEMGTSLSEAMQSHEKIFGHMFITLVAAGEASGSLDVSFSRMATQFEKDAKIKGMIKKASTYPMMIGILAVVIIAVMLGYVVPQYETMLADLGTELPGITLAVVAASDFITGKWYIVLAVAAAVTALFLTYKRSESGSRVIGRLTTKLPLFGKLSVKNASARMARTLSTLLGAGLPMLQALEITADTMSNMVFKDALQNARDDVAMGEKLSESIKRSELFPPLVYHMLNIGEESGDIENMLTNLADYYEEEVEETTGQVMTAIEPLIIVVMAGIVMVIVGAVMMPMMQMYDAMDNL